MNKDFIVGPLVRRIYLIRKDPNSKVRFLGVDCNHCGHTNDVDGAEFPDLDAADAKIKELTKANENLAANLYLSRENDSDSWKAIAEKFEESLAKMREERDQAREMWQRYEKDALNEAHDAALLRSEIKKLKGDLLQERMKNAPEKMKEFGAAVGEDITKAQFMDRALPLKALSRTEIEKENQMLKIGEMQVHDLGIQGEFQLLKIFFPLIQGDKQVASRGIVFRLKPENLPAYNTGSEFLHIEIMKRD